MRLSPAPTRTTRRLIPAARMTSSDADSYAARRRPIVTAEATTDVGMRPGRREVVARPEPEREHDERDDDEAGEDATRARPQLALAVEPGLGEDEDRDRRGELEPFGRSLAPEQAPEDVAVAGDDLAEDEREVDPEREPDDVQDDERHHGKHAADDGEDRPAREQVEARGANVTSRGAGGVGAGRDVSAGGASLPTRREA